VTHSVFTSYEQDFYAWLLNSAQLLRERQFAHLDIEHLAEELEGMARSDKRQLLNRLAVLLAHLLKWQFQPSLRSKSWWRTIKEQRKRIQLLLEDSPSLKPELNLQMQHAYELARLSAANETGMDEESFPDSCEYSLAEILLEEFYPE
jgi:hypothetical protein